MQLTFHTYLILTLSLLGLFTGIFYFLTIISPDKKVYKKNKNYRPMVSIIIPVWNEGSSNGERLRKTVESLLNCDYPKDKLEIIIVNDGSTDNSLSIARSYEKDGVKVFTHNKSKGKTNAVNIGLKNSKGEFIAALDADSFIEADVLDKLIPCFKDKNVMATVPSIKIWKPKNILEKIQFLELLSGVFIRHVQSELGSIPMAPGAFTLVRKSFAEQYGFLNPNTMVEDLELSLRIQSKKYLIENVVNANVYTSGVKTLKAFISQRVRWYYGFIIQIRKYKHLFSSEYGNLGLFILPTTIIFAIVSMFIFTYGIMMTLINTANWIKDLMLIGFDFKNFFEITIDPFFYTIDNVTVLPIIMFFAMLGFMYYIKKVSNEKQNIFWPFILFSLTYWFLGSLTWILSIYYYIRKKPIKWGPNYFNS